MSDEKTKKRAKHTPGPWWADVEHGHIFAGEGQDRRIADVRGWGWLQHQPNPEQTQDANARLIAAAPDMAAALLYLRERTDARLWAPIDAALAKAGVLP